MLLPAKTSGRKLRYADKNITFSLFKAGSIQNITSKMQLDKICRGCLCEDEDMKNMSNDVFQKFLTVTNLTKQEEVPNMSLNICRSCEEKLTISVEFQEKCRQSHETLLDYLKNSDGVNERLNEEETVQGNDDKTTLHLERFSHYKVAEAIADSQATFYGNVHCIWCNFVGSNERSLSIHISLVHREFKTYWCRSCNAIFEDLKNHTETCHSNDVTCKFCNKKFQSKGHLTEHVRSHSDVGQFQCTVCEKRFNSQSRLNVHLRKHTQEKPYKCHLCIESFIRLNQLRRHLKNHDDVEQADEKERFVGMQNFCVTCQKKVRSLLMHNKQVHSNCGSNTLCTVCGKQFKTVTKLKVHMRVHTGETPYKCTYCDKRVRTRSHLVLHERTHTGERPHFCHVCGKNFSQSSVLNTHMRLHTGRTISCKICQQQFCRPAQLRLHLRSHTGEKPYICSECGRGFTQRSHLVEHNKIHSDLRPYQCSYCDKAFKQGSSLKHHVRIHLGEKPYKCNQCTYACRQSYSLTQHMKQHSVDKPRADRPHVCSMCTKSFSTDAMLTSHFNNTHNVVGLYM